MCFHAYYIWFLSLSLFKDFFVKTLNDVRFNFRWNVITLSCFFTHFQRLAVCPILNKMNKKPILPCATPMGECAVNTIIRTKVTTLMASRMANIVHSHSNTSMLPMAIQTDLSLHMLPFVYLTAIPTRLLA